MKFKAIFTFMPILFSVGVMASEGSEFEKLSPHKAMQKANLWYGTGKAMIQVRPNEIIGKFKDGSIAQIPLEDEFLVSIAPYIKRSHPCSFHGPTGCTGELQDKNVGVTIYDDRKHQQILSKVMRTNSNGFIDLWLPRDKEHLKVAITYKGMKATKEIGTTNEDLTCITDMKLQKV
ncbi:CueP family metal-binding protein [Vibrio mediterranei]